MWATLAGMLLFTVVSLDARGQNDVPADEDNTAPMPEEVTPPAPPAPDESEGALEEAAETEEEAAPEAAPGPEVLVEENVEEDAEEGVEEDVALEEPFIPEIEDDRVEYDDDALEDALEEVSDGKPFGKGEKELGIGLGMAGYGDNYYIGIGASFAYYVIKGLAPGLSLNYTTDFGSTEMADSITVLPYLKWVFFRSHKFSPYVVVDAGKEWQWAGQYPAHSWIAGAGFGAHIGIGKHVMINVSILFQHHWYDDPRVNEYPDDKVYTDDNGYDFWCGGLGTCNLDGWEYSVDTQNYITGLCEDPTDPDTCAEPISDKKDIEREWIYPIINLGVSIMF